MSLGIATHSFDAALGLVLDGLYGEPAAAVHPVAHFGHAMSAVERHLYSPSRSRGVAHALVGLGLGVGGGLLLRSTAVATGIAVGGRSLRDAALAVDAALRRGDVESARVLMPTLVGRDPTELDKDEMARATVESVAENTVDAVVAPTLWGAFAGAPGALGYRAVNTMDAMVGHHSDRYEAYGWAGARLDDVANWIPARVTAALVALVRPRSTSEIRRAVRDQAGAHPSPNAGVVEAAFAAALGLRLGGRNRYGTRVEERPALGWGRAAQPRDIAPAVRLSRDVTVALGALLVVASTARGGCAS